MTSLSQLLHLIFDPILRGFRLSPTAMLGVLFPIVPIIVAWPRRRNLPAGLKWALLYLFCTLAEDLLMVYWSRHGRHNLWIMNSYIPIEAIILGLMFSRWQLRERWRMVIYVALGLFVVFWATTIGSIEGFDEFPRVARPVEALLVMAAAAGTLVERSRHSVSPLSLHPWFWVSVGTLLYFAYLMLLDPVGQLLVDNHRPDLWKVAYSINGVLAAVMYLFWLRAFLLIRRPQKVGATP